MHASPAWACACKTAQTCRVSCGADVYISFVATARRGNMAARHYSPRHTVLAHSYCARTALLQWRGGTFLQNFARVRLTAYSTQWKRRGASVSSGLKKKKASANCKRSALSFPASLRDTYRQPRLLLPERKTCAPRKKRFRDKRQTLSSTVQHKPKRTAAAAQPAKGGKQTWGQREKKAAMRFLSLLLRRKEKGGRVGGGRGGIRTVFQLRDPFAFVVSSHVRVARCGPMQSGETTMVPCALKLSPRTIAAPSNSVIMRWPCKLSALRGGTELERASGRSAGRRRPAHACLIVARIRKDALVHNVSSNITWRAVDRLPGRQQDLIAVDGQVTAMFLGKGSGADHLLHHHRARIR
eukprot:IDg4831t1